MRLSAAVGGGVYPSGEQEIKFTCPHTVKVTLSAAGGGGVYPSGEQEIIFTCPHTVKVTLSAAGGGGVPEWGTGNHIYMSTYCQSDADCGRGGGVPEWGTGNHIYMSTYCQSDAVRGRGGVPEWGTGNHIYMSTYCQSDAVRGRGGGDVSEWGTGTLSAAGGRGVYPSRLKRCLCQFYEKILTLLQMEIDLVQWNRKLRVIVFKGWFASKRINIPVVVLLEIMHQLRCIIYL